MQNTPALTLAVFVGLLATSQAVLSQSSVNQAGRLTKLWETQPVFKAPHSVAFDPGQRTIYVCNESITGDPETGPGFVSTVSVTGEVLNLEWVSGLASPKDMALKNGRLYVTGTSELFEIDVANARLRRRYYNDRAVDLKSVVAGPAGEVYVSDRGASRVFSLKNGTFSELVSDNRFERTAGLLLVKDELYACVRNRILALDLETQGLRTVFRLPSALNALAAVGDGSMLAVDATGGISLLGRDGTQTKLIERVGAGSGATGICYVPEERMLLVSATAENKLIAYQFD